MKKMRVLSGIERRRGSQGRESAPGGQPAITYRMRRKTGFHKPSEDSFKTSRAGAAALKLQFGLLKMKTQLIMIFMISVSPDADPCNRDTQKDQRSSFTTSL